MPNRDGTGPTSQGPLTGRGLGPCSRNSRGMPGRPRRLRRVRFQPEATFFKPAGVPLRDLEEIIISIDELEAIRLKNLEELNQNKAAEKMKISQPTFNRLLISARKKITDALENGKAIKLEGGDYEYKE